MAFSFYKYPEFGAGVSSLHARAGSLGYGGRIEVRTDRPDGPLLCACEVPRTGGWNRWTTVCAKVETPVSGVHALYLAFSGGIGRLLNLDRFWFTRI
jgi:hypothetical protein